MKKCLFLLGVLFISATSFSQGTKTIESDAFGENVAITASFTRNLDAKTFVKEIKLVSFSASYALPLGFGLKEINYSDNGKLYDLVAGDGIYTSVDRYEITDKQASNPVGVSVPVLQQIVVDASFKHDDQLAKGEYSGKIKIKCRVYKCGCPCNTFTCGACILFGWSCIAVEWCEIDFEL
ncbi:MAG: hypothetical protein HYZ15_13240 [Sphingobacteriales bacterium]|nr:hypothetical protein [Sphingobacteriales bacterium]